MASIIREAVINAPAEQCWDAVRAFDALHERLARGFVTGLSVTDGPLNAVHYTRIGELMDAGLRAITATLEG